MNKKQERKNYPIRFYHRKLTRKDLKNIEKIILKHAKPYDMRVFRFGKEYASVKYIPNIRFAFIEWQFLRPAFSVEITPFVCLLRFYPLYYVDEQRERLAKMVVELRKYCEQQPTNERKLRFFRKHSRNVNATR